MAGWLRVIVSTLVLKRLSEASGAGGFLWEGRGESRAGTTKVGVAGHTAPVWCLLGGSTRPTRGSLGGSAWMGHAEEEGGWPTEGPVKMGEGGGGERDAEEK